jgi:hypothetical protein
MKCNSGVSFDEFITQEFLGRPGEHASSLAFSHESEANGVALMNGFLREERLNSRVTVLPGIPLRARRSDFARSAGEQRALTAERSDPEAAFKFPPVTIYTNTLGCRFDVRSRRPAAARDIFPMAGGEGKKEAGAEALGAFSSSGGLHAAKSARRAFLLSDERSRTIVAAGISLTAAFNKSR